MPPPNYTAGAHHYGSHQGGYPPNSGALFHGGGYGVNQLTRDPSYVPHHLAASSGYPDTSHHTDTGALHGPDYGQGYHQGRRQPPSSSAGSQQSGSYQAYPPGGYPGYQQTLSSNTGISNTGISNTGISNTGSTHGDPSYRAPRAYSSSEPPPPSYGAYSQGHEQGKVPRKRPHDHADASQPAPGTHGDLTARQHPSQAPALDVSSTNNINRTSELLLPTLRVMFWSLANAKCQLKMTVLETNAKVPKIKDIGSIDEVAVDGSQLGLKVIQKLYLGQSQNKWSEAVEAVKQNEQMMSQEEVVRVMKGIRDEILVIEKLDSKEKTEQHLGTIRQELEDQATEAIDYLKSGAR
eukprot:GHVU01061950.1.p1 GENE.GHVU01061950.1~~GHVU01061950.1.p1  ORF type:complete len:351 (+),score=34.62 GHVU01061950.1:1-1053(+)